MSEATYNEDNIRSLDWKEHIRLRPGMYIGKLGDGSSYDDGIYILLKEVLDNCIDEFVMGQLGLNGISNSVLGRLVLAARCKVTSDAAAAADEILSVANPESALEEIARQLLTPFAKEGVLAQAEEAQ